MINLFIGIGIGLCNAAIILALIYHNNKKEVKDLLEDASLIIDSIKETDGNYLLTRVKQKIAKFLK